MIKQSNVKYADELIRLKRIEGQIEGLQKMIQNNREYSEILQQMKAASSALKAVETSLLKNHLTECIKASAKTKSGKKFDQAIEELLNFIKL